MNDERPENDETEPVCEPTLVRIQAEFHPVATRPLGNNGTQGQGDRIRSEMSRLLRQVPFHPFTMVLEHGERVLVEHPENIAFDPGSAQRPGSHEFRAIVEGRWFFGTFEKVKSIVQRDVNDQSK